MCKFAGKWFGKGYIYTKNTSSDDDIVKTKDHVEIHITMQSKYIYEIKVKSDFISNYVDYFLGFYNYKAKTIQAIHHTSTNETNGISNFYIANNKLYNMFNFIFNNKIIVSGEIKLKKQKIKKRSTHYNSKK